MTILDQVFVVILGYGILHSTSCSALETQQTTKTNEPNSAKISSRNYGNTADSSSSYYTYTGYPSYGSSSSGTFTDTFNPNEYPTYFTSPQDNKKKPSIPSYPTYPTTFYPSGPFVSPECQEQMMTGVIGDVLQSTGVGNFGLLRSVVAAVTAAILTKIPIILAVKALIIKLILVPLGFLVLSLPIILPILLLFSPLWTKLKEVFTGVTTPTPTMVVMMAPNATNATSPKQFRTLDYGRDMFLAIMESDRCFEKLACLLGSKDANTPYIKPVSWLLKFLQTFKFVQNNIEIRSTLKRYRDAYLQGVQMGKKSTAADTNSTADIEEVCTDQLYPCNTPSLYARPEFVGVSRYL